MVASQIAALSNIGIVSVLAKQMATDARPRQPEPECCVQSGILWNLAAVYAKGVLWEERMPTATVFNGPVVYMTEPLETALSTGSAAIERDGGIKPR